MIRYQKTTEVVKAAGEKTTSVFGSLGGSVARKLGEVKNSNAFKSFEEKVVSATGSLKVYKKKFTIFTILSLINFFN